MPTRKTPLVSGEYYHVFNRTQNKEPAFTSKKDCERVIKTIGYYFYQNPPMRLSYFLQLGVDRRDEVISKMGRSQKIVDIISYCLMPNHFHLLLKQVTDDGISNFLSLLQNSLTKYRNTKYKREGHLFQGRFKAVYIEDDVQLLHLSRYIHLNPYASSVVRTIEELANYPYSSLREYLRMEDGFCTREIIEANFKTTADYRKFVFDHADYQKRLHKIKHLTLDVDSPSV